MFVGEKVFEPEQLRVSDYIETLHKVICCVNTCVKMFTLQTLLSGSTRPMCCPSVMDNNFGTKFETSRCRKNVDDKMIIVNY